MKLLFTITFPTESFNTLVRAGDVGQKIGAIIEATKPESIYFTGNGSGRGAVAVYDVADGSQVPAAGEPWMLTFNAQIEYEMLITPEELGKSGLDELVKKWG
ncbi:MAG: panthothenate synthetase [Chloroflexota bacterium]